MVGGGGGQVLPRIWTFPRYHGTTDVRNQSGRGESSTPTCDDLRCLSAWKEVPIRDSVFYSNSSRISKYTEERKSRQREQARPWFFPCSTGHIVHGPSSYNLNSNDSIGGCRCRPPLPIRNSISVGAIPGHFPSFRYLHLPSSCRFCFRFVAYIYSSTN